MTSKIHAFCKTMITLILRMFNLDSMSTIKKTFLFELSENTTSRTSTKDRLQISLLILGEIKRIN